MHVSMNVATGVNIQEKMNNYQTTYEFAKVTDIKEYTQQTLGNIIDQMGIIVIGGMIITVLMIVLITALFLRMLLSKDVSQIAIMRSIGLTSKQIRHQYMAGMLMVLVLGILFGALASNYIGEFLVSLAMSFMGAAKIELVQVAWQTWLLWPLLLIVTVAITLYVSCKPAVKGDLSARLKV
jgi:putative ABC transport system permease protein